MKLGLESPMVRVFPDRDPARRGPMEDPRVRGDLTAPDGRDEFSPRGVGPLPAWRQLDDEHAEFCLDRDPARKPGPTPTRLGAESRIRTGSLQERRGLSGIDR